MIWLLDVNALIAACLSAHEHHGRVTGWIASLPASDLLATCSITELGFVRVIHQAPQFRIPVADGIATLARLQSSKKRKVVRLADDRGAGDLPPWVKSARQITDGHLLSLAAHHSSTLATLDTGIPGAFLIP